MDTITYYIKGKIKRQEELNTKTVKNCHGMKVKCTLKDGSEKIGYANSYYSFKKGHIVIGDEADSLEYITLETFANFDEETHELKGDIEHRFDMNKEMILIKLISNIDALLYSNPRWTETVTNEFR